MRNTILVLALLISGGFFLAAQTRSDVSVYVAPVTGKGSKPEDNSLFYTRLVNELTLQKAVLAMTQKDSGFSLFGDLAPLNNEGQYVFHLGLWDNKAGGYKVEGELVYKTPNDTNQLFPVLVANLLYTIPPDPVSTETPPAETPPVDDKPPAADNPQDTGSTDDIPQEPDPDPGLIVRGRDYDYRDNLLYLGLAAIWSPRIYIDDDGNTSGHIRYVPSFGISLEWHFQNVMSVETGAELATDELVAFPNANKDNRYNNTMIEIPLLIKFVFKPGSGFMLEPYVGGYASIAFFNTDRNTKPPFPLFSWLLGFQLGYKLGPGAIFADARFAMDIFPSKVKAIPPATDEVNYKRNIIHLGLGYKYGIIQRKVK